MTTLAMVQDGADKLHEAAQSFFGAGLGLIGAIVAIGSMLGLLTLTLVVAPGVTSRCAGALRERAFPSFLAGAAMLVVFGIGAAIGSKVPPIALVTVCGFGVLAIFGLAAASEDIGRRLAWICGHEGSRARHLITGWLVFAGAACVPVVGWFIVLPYGLISGLGSIPVGLLSRGASAAAAPREHVDIEIH